MTAFPSRIARMRFVLWVSLAAALGACAPRSTVPVNAAPAPAPAPNGKSTWRAVDPAKQKLALVPDPVGVPAADPSCEAYRAHTGSHCGEQAADLAALDAALSIADPLEQDDALACLESKKQFGAGLIRALRVELAPLPCADALALPFLDPRRPELDRSVEDALIALAAAGRLSRLVQKPPELPTPFDKPHFLEFFEHTLKPWIVTQASAIHDLSAVGPRLGAYGKGVVAIEAGLADMRFVSVVRQVSLPKEMSDDPEVREAYYAALDEALEPRKARGRDAALVGLRELANVGVLRDTRVERARALLSEVYSGRRIDALDRLLMPALEAPARATVEQRLAARLPTFYAGFVLASAPLDAELLRALLERGLPRAVLAHSDPKQLDEKSRDLFVRALLDRGSRYVRAEDFAVAGELSANATPNSVGAFYHALASALRNGPRDATELLRGLGWAPPGVQVAELDQLSAQKANPHAPLAAFDAAYLLGLAPPQNDARFWEQLAVRFEQAARALRDPAQQRLGRESAAAARDTGKAIRASHAASGPAAR